MSRKPESSKAPPGWLDAVRRSIERHIAEVRAEEAREVATEALERIRRNVKRRPKP